MALRLIFENLKFRVTRCKTLCINLDREASKAVIIGPLKLRNKLELKSPVLYEFKSVNIMQCFDVLLMWIWVITLIRPICCIAINKQYTTVAVSSWQGHAWNQQWRRIQAGEMCFNWKEKNISNINIKVEKTTIKIYVCSET